MQQILRQSPTRGQRQRLQLLYKEVQSCYTSKTNRYLSLVVKVCYQLVFLKHQSKRDHTLSCLLRHEFKQERVTIAKLYYNITVKGSKCYLPAFHRLHYWRPNIHTPVNTQNEIKVLETVIFNLCPHRTNMPYLYHTLILSYI